MRPVCIYPGSFDPPTYGHLNLLRKAAEIFPAVTVLCSVNPGKSGQWFSPDRSRSLWNGYRLPENARVLTIDEFLAGRPDTGGLVMVRGIRNEADAEEEKKVMLYNHDRFGVCRFFHIFNEEYRDVSSTKARRAAQALDWRGIRRCVAPRVASALLEKALGAANLCLVVGPPGGGKSAFLKRVAETDPASVHVETDRFLDELKPEILRRFRGRDQFQIALEREEELKAFVAPLWFEKLGGALAAAPAGANIFVEAAYALQADKELFRMLGGKIVYVDCGGSEENCRRITARGTPQHLAFVDRIPGWPETAAIAAEHRLLLARVDTSGDPSALRRRAEEFCGKLKGGELWNECSSA